ncbi:MULTISPECIES: hypothetical protein [Mycobacteriaceae]|jgi:hypothetical protein|uniref:Uncharacterized protein n=2 Tax=Mycobacteriaceae TaxID=1762 RepID=A0A1S1JZP8_9MYCO|nr:MULTISPECIES: hypothetical protein [Mycobacteriaceae]MBP2451942.1 hypothetical protein [Mycolicibacterium lutetiense]OHT97130.1 hypothetical protein BKG61_17890 [Mycobacterium syngnathidarum]
MFVCEFQKIRSGEYFGRSEHPDRTTAEQHATAELALLGEDPADVLLAVAAAGFGCADTRGDGYGVRIFEE